ncbi:hypothetical protein PISMIDRAFT_669985 [Pisolithus microcarpus 441]|uniref:Uncharacterized protein n=1 Tax=Pisolithus microcarpus 441 TaxID=765257 RepID=A0A0C9Z0R0_9AGAM|nr:hypothetical protein PISMIDRAFT_669985 [Pisolithus microcarpus 441]
MNCCSVVWCTLDYYTAVRIFLWQPNQRVRLHIEFRRQNYYEDDNRDFFWVHQPPVTYSCLRLGVETNAKAGLWYSCSGSRNAMHWCGE